MRGYNEESYSVPWKTSKRYEQEIQVKAQQIADGQHPASKTTETNSASSNMSARAGA